MSKVSLWALTIAIVVPVVVPVIVMAAGVGGQTVYLKGTGSDFTEQWRNVFVLGGAEDAADPNVWHLLYTGKNVDDVTAMQLTFTNGEVFSWTPDLGFSTNSGGNNPGWVVVAPYDWAVSYVNSGNNNESASFLVTNDESNVNFNISGFHRGKGTPPPPEGAITLKKTVDGVAFESWVSGYEGDRDALLAGITFGLYAAGAESVRTRVFDPASAGLPVATGGVGASSGLIDFTAALRARAGGFAGYYWVVEALSGPAAAVFEPVAPLLVHIGGNGAISTGGFDYDALYTVVNGYGSGYTLGYPGLNNTGDIFPIAVTDSATGVVYPSFCANAGSTHFAGESGLGCAGYLVASRLGKEL
ncbi:MAG: hypothetical protein FWE94_02825, partial [Coriobacteriia bacterium]|nr:hypothetical protein [Coriobacteriia bacterium]